MARATKKAARRRPQRTAAAPPTTPPPPAAGAPAGAPAAALQMQPAESLQEIALVLHRLTANVQALVQISAQRLEVEREQLKLGQQARELVLQQKATSAGLEAVLPRMLERLLERAMGPEPRGASAPAVETHGGALTERGLVCR